MLDFPEVPRAFLERWIVDEHHPAYIAVDKEGCVVEAGGALEHYGLRLRPGDRAADHLLVLEGTLPLAGEPVRIDGVELTAEVRADLHAFSRQGSDFVLLLDTAAMASHLQMAQQRGNELILLQRELKKEKQRSEELLRSVLPASIAERMKAGETMIAESFDEATILFADIFDFGRLTADKTATAVVELLNGIFRAFDALADRHGVEKIKTIADCYMCACGLTAPHPDHAHAAAEMALGMQEAAAQFSAAAGQTLQLRIGIHTGPVVAGVIGTQRVQYDLWGDTVSIANQVETFGVPGRIQVTEKTYLLLAADYDFQERGRFYVKGLGDVGTYLLSGRRPGR